MIFFSLPDGIDQKKKMDLYYFCEKCGFRIGTISRFRTVCERYKCGLTLKEIYLKETTVKKHTKKKLEIDKMNNLPKELISSIKDYVIDNKVLKNLLLLNIELKTVIPKNYSYTRAEDYNCLTCIEPELL